MEESRNASIQGHGERILVVDDNPDAADSLALLLELHDYETRTAYGGTQAIEAARSFRPDLVILDVDMPMMNGYRVAEILRRSLRVPRVILIALTGRTNPEDKAAALDAGFDEHFDKPLRLDRLDAMVARVLVRHGRASANGVAHRTPSARS